MLPMYIWPILIGRFCFYLKWKWRRYRIWIVIITPLYYKDVTTFLKLEWVKCFHGVIRTKYYFLKTNIHHFQCCYYGLIDSLFERWICNRNRVAEWRASQTLLTHNTNCLSSYTPPVDWTSVNIYWPLTIIKYGDSKQDTSKINVLIPCSF